MSGNLAREDSDQKLNDQQKMKTSKMDSKNNAEMRTKAIEINKMNSNASLPKLFLDSASTLVHTSGPSHMFPK